VRRVPTLSDIKLPQSVGLDAGAEAAAQRAVRLDHALCHILQSSLGDRIAVMAVGGYGRGQLSPHSDIDLLIVTGRGVSAGTDIKSLLYPLWDGGFQVGHAVRTPREAVDRCTGDLHAATSLLSARMITGETALYEELMDRRSRWLRRDARHLVRKILDARSHRHRDVDRAGWSLAPDLKEDVGGLRDIHTVEWVRTILGVPPGDVLLDEPGSVLLAVREALHGRVRRKTDRIHLGLQPAIAAHVGMMGEGAVDELMQRVHSSARTIENRSEDALEMLTERVSGGPRRSGFARAAGTGIVIEDGLLHVEQPLEGGDLEVALRLLVARSRTGRPVARRSIEWLRTTLDRDPIERWSDEMLDLFLVTLRGPHVIDALELLDRVNGWSALLPEWQGIRGRAQYDLYHRLTVDGHSFLTVAEIGRVMEQHPLAGRAAAEAKDLDALYLAALMHDIGKGSGEDHSVAGARLAGTACRRMATDPSTGDEVSILVRDHLLLADTATRRDLEDGAVIESVAKDVADPRVLRLLLILAMADARATGPEAWNPWKEALVVELYRKAVVALETGEIPSRTDVVATARELETYEPTLAGRSEAVLNSLPPSYLSSASIPDMVDEVRLLLQRPGPGRVTFRIDRGTENDQAVVTVCAMDRPGTLARTAGVLALHRISVMRAQAYSTADGYALERFIVLPPPSGSWERVMGDLEAAYSGALAVEARVARKANDYGADGSIRPDVRMLQDASQDATVIEVRAPDAFGLLFAIAAGLSDLELDIQVAKIDTLGDRVVDVFYVRTPWGSKLDDAQAREVERSISHRIARLAQP